MGTTRTDDVTILVFRFHLLAEEIFYRIQRVGWQEFAIGKNINAVIVPGDTGELFHIAIPWRQVCITDGPVYGETITLWSFKVEITPALSLSCPKQRLSSHLVTADPIKRILLYVWMLIIFYKEVCGIFSERV